MTVPTFTTCMECQVQDGIPNFASAGVERIPDDGVIELTCDRGHHTFQIMHQPKFEILCELAVIALNDGYYREAVTSFASSLERLYEYYVDVVCRARDIDRAAFLAAWKPLTNASERQLGAFAMTYLIETGEPFTMLADKQTAFRNKVIHQGLIPSRAEAIAYGQAAGDCAVSLIDRLEAPSYEEARTALTLDGIRKKSERARELGARVASSFLPTPFSAGRSPAGFDLEAILADRATRPKMEQFVAAARVAAQFIAQSRPAPDGEDAGISSEHLTVPR